MSEWIVGGAVIVAMQCAFARWVWGRLTREKPPREVITYRFDPPKRIRLTVIEGVPPHAAGRDVAGRETFVACGRLS